MATTLTTEHSYTGNGSTTNYSVTFTYLKEADVKVTLDHVATTAYTFANASTISFTTAPANGVAIRIFRDTDVDAARFVFSSGSALKAGELNENLDQLLYADQERASTDNIADQAVTTAKLRDGAVTTAKFANLSVATAQLADSSVTTAKIAADAVNGTKISDNSINSEHYVDGSIDTAHIADAQVTTAKIADSAITETKLADNSVTSAKIVNGTIAAVDLATNAVTASKIASNAVVEAKILNGAVTTNKVSDGAITSGKIANDTIVNADVNASAAIDGTKVSPDFGSQTITTTGSITVSGTVDGRDVSTDGTKLDGIESGATADQTAAEVRTLVGSATDSNVFTDAEKSKLTGISAGADVTSTKSINDLTDVNTSGVSDGKILKYQASSSSFIIADDSGGSTGATTFTGLTDTPANYGSAAGKVLNINAAGNAVEFNSNLTIDSSGNVGIGITAPPLELSVNGDAGFYAGTTEFGRVFNDAGVFHIRGAANMDLALGTQAQERLRIDSSGRVGIGTSSMSSYEQSFNNLVIEEQGNAGITIATPPSGSTNFLGQIAFAKGTTGDNAYRGLIRYSHIDDAFSLFTAGLNERLRVDSSGRVGIGITPTAPLHVGGTIQSQTGSSVAQMYTDGGSANFASVGSYPAIFRTNGAERMRIDSSGNVGIGTSSPATDFHIHRSGGGDNSEILLTNGDTGSTATDGFKIALNSGEGGEIWNYENDYIRFGTNNTERMRIDSSGNVGIGTSNPQKPFNIVAAGTELIRLSQTVNSGTQQEFGIGWAASNTHTHPSAKITTKEFDTSDSRASLLFYTRGSNADSAPDERMRIDSSGRLLVGASSVGYTNAADNLTIEDSGHCGITLRSGSSNSGNIYFSDSTGQGAGTYAGIVEYNHASNYMQFWTNSSQRMRIDSSGRVGIGIVPSSSPLEVLSGTSNSSLIEASGASAGRGLKISTYANIANDAGVLIEAPHANYGQLAFGTAGSERMRIDSSGNVGIGTSSPAYQLDVQGSGNSRIRVKNTSVTGEAQFHHDGNGDLFIKNSVSNRNISFVNNGSERMKIDSSGNVGIGTSSPTSYASSQKTLVIQDSGSPAIAWSDTGQTRDWFAVAQGSGLFFKYADGGGSGSASNVTNALTLDNSGNVGINELSPAHELHVSDSDKPEIVAEDTTNNVKAYLGAADTNGRVGTLSNHDFAIRTNDTERMRIDSAGAITATGSATFAGSVTATNTAKAWIKWDGTVSSNYILDSFGVDSLDDNSTGNFTIHLTDTMQNADYVVVCGATTDGTGGVDTWINAYAQTTTTFRVQSQNASSQNTNRSENFAVVFGDKA